VGYGYDIFLSYKRGHEASKWLDGHFQPLLEHFVELELGRDVRIFRDRDEIEVGNEWPVKLAHALGQSAVVVALWSRLYFNSEWCRRELSTIRAREEDEGLRAADNPSGLILPVVIHDCESLDAPWCNVQYFGVQRYYDPRMRAQSEDAERLSQLVRDRIAPQVARAIVAAPAYRAEWPLETAAHWLAELRKTPQARQHALPRMT
jgi:hypothetical protein